jgi:RNA polymerase sigma factor (sigma-70 family)
VRSPDPVERLFVAHRSTVFGYLARRSGDRELASDLTQETFVRVARNLNGFSGGSETAWLLTIARNLLIDHWKRRRLPINDRALIDALAGDEQLEDAATTRLFVHHTLTQLEPRDRRLLTLLYLEGFTTREVAAMAGTTDGSVRMAALRARDAFRVHAANQHQGSETT